jgi:hypothetical protein
VGVARVERGPASGSLLLFDHDGALELAGHVLDGKEPLYLHMKGNENSGGRQMRWKEMMHRATNEKGREGVETKSPPSSKTSRGAVTAIPAGIPQFHHALKRSSACLTGAAPSGFRFRGLRFFETRPPMTLCPAAFSSFSSASILRRCSSVRPPLTPTNCCLNLSRSRWLGSRF